MIISLTGFMGCGKSSVGRKLSQLLCCPFIDLDSVIEERAGATIPEIFARDGEAAFRKMELDALTDIINSSPGSLVLSLGGGAIMTPACAEIIESSTTCIYLRTSIDTLMKRLSGQTEGRPLLSQSPAPDCHSDQNVSNCHSDRAKRVEESQTRTRITTLLSLRSDTYEKTADIIIDTDGKSIEAVASEIISILS